MPSDKPAIAEITGGVVSVGGIIGGTTTGGTGGGVIGGTTAGGGGATGGTPNWANAGALVSAIRLAERTVDKKTRTL